MQNAKAPHRKIVSEVEIVHRDISSETQIVHTKTQITSVRELEPGKSYDCCQLRPNGRVERETLGNLVEVGPRWMKMMRGRHMYECSLADNGVIPYGKKVWNAITWLELTTTTLELPITS